MSTIEEQYAEALRKQNKRRSSFWSVARVIILLTVFAGITVFISQKIISVYTVPSASMINTIVPGEKILVNQLYPTFYEIQRGDIIVFEDPGSWLTPIEKESGNTLVKRVVAVGGDTIECCDMNGNLVLNNETVIEPYIDVRDAASEKTFSETVPEGYVFVMGDNRNNSNDSRFNNENTGGKFIALKDIKGKAFIIFSPQVRNLE
jgi:signal peptidase I